MAAADRLSNEGMLAVYGVRGGDKNGGRYAGIGERKGTVNAGLNTEGKKGDAKNEKGNSSAEQGAVKPSSNAHKIRLVTMNTKILVFFIFKHLPVL